MKVNRHTINAVRIIRMGITFGPAVRRQLATRQLPMRLAQFYRMMAKLEDRLIVRGYYQPVNGIPLRCYEYNERKS